MQVIIRPPRQWKNWHIQRNHLVCTLMAQDHSLSGHQALKLANKQMRTRCQKAPASTKARRSQPPTGNGKYTQERRKAKKVRAGGESPHASHIAKGRRIRREELTLPHAVVNTTPPSATKDAPLP